MIKVYNCSICSKSCAALNYLKEKSLPFEVINYLETPPTREEIEKLLALLHLKPIDIIRTNEPIWIERYADREQSDNLVFEALEHHPQLLQRPIVVNGNKAIIARPNPEKIEEIL